MSNNQPAIDEKSIDDLVAGQLNRERYREVIRALDADPVKWRACALAFLEDQALRAELRELAKGTIDWCDRTPSATAGQLDRSKLESSDNVKAAYSFAAEANNLKQPAGSISERAAYAPPRLSSHLLSTAALLMVSFTIGWLGSELIAEREQLAAPKLGSVAGANSTEAPAARKSEAAQPSTMQPQFVLDQPGQFMPLDHEIPHSIRELERRGRVHLESQEGLVPQRMSDGSTVFIPVQEVRIIPATLSF